MATIIEGRLWTVTCRAAEQMMKDGLIFECSANHADVLNIDKPIYHRAVNAPDWFGVNTLSSTIFLYQQRY